VSIAHWHHLILVSMGLPFVVFHPFEIHPNALLISLNGGNHASILRSFDADCVIWIGRG
jgi:hypothetical protein